MRFAKKWDLIKYLKNVRSSNLHVLLPDLIIFIRSLTSMAVIWKSLTILNTYKALINETNSQILNSLACFASTILLTFSSALLFTRIVWREVKKVNYYSWDLIFPLDFHAMWFVHNIYWWLLPSWIPVSINNFIFH